MVYRVAKFAHGLTDTVGCVFRYAWIVGNHIRHRRLGNSSFMSYISNRHHNSHYSGSAGVSLESPPMGAFY